MEGKRKAINFDLDTKKLKNFYTTQTGKKFNKAYYDIKAFMKANGFSHRQGSGYISNEPLEPAEISAIIMKMRQTFPWIRHCVKHIDVTVIEKQFDLRDAFDFENNDKPAKKQIRPIKSADNKSYKEETVTISKAEYESLLKKIDELTGVVNKANIQNAHLTNVINKTNEILNDNPELKENFKEAKKQSIEKEKSEVKKPIAKDKPSGKGHR